MPSTRQAPTHALSTPEVSREMTVIAEAWKLLSPLDTKARERVLQWLRQWVTSEGGSDSVMF